MKTLLFALATPLLVVPALSGPSQLTESPPGYNSRISSAVPPLRFHGDNGAVVIFASNVSEFCQADVPEGMAVLACQFETVDGIPVMVLPNPCPMAEVEYTARIACHELAHRNGWAGDHPL